MESDLPKPLVELRGKALLARVIEALREGGVERIAVVLGHRGREIEETLPDDVDVVYQAEGPGGTATALEAARGLAEGCERLLVTMADAGLLRGEEVRLLVEGAGTREITLLSAHFPLDLPYGRLVRGESGAIQRSVERRHATPRELLIREYNASHYLFQIDDLWELVARIEVNPVSGERYLTELVEMISSRGGEVEALHCDDWRTLVGINDMEGLRWAERILEERNWG